MFYNLLRLILNFIVLIVCIFSKKKREFFAKRYGQNLDFLDRNKEYIWIHASSVGEINLADSLVKTLLKETNNHLILSLFTDTGYATAVKKYAGNSRIKVMYFPLDDYFILRRIISKINLKSLFIIETEIWPNLINLFSKKAKVYLVNGRISDKSYKKYEFFRPLLKRILTGKISTYFMQTEEDRNRIINLGAHEEKTHVVGNLKFDIEIKNYSAKERQNLKDILNIGDKKIFVAGSTRTGEYDILLDAHKELKDYILVLVPRHLERIPNIIEILEERKLKFKKFSEIKSKTSSDSYDVLIVDEMGILRKFYSIGDVNFVGGTLTNIGGHSLLEPLFFRKPPLFGPYLQNVRDISKEILKRNIGAKIETAQDIVKAINKIENNEFEINSIDEFFKDNNKVVEKIMKIYKENQQ